VSTAERGPGAGLGFGLFAAAALAMAALVGGCASKGEQLEAKIAKEIERDDGVKGVKVHCPGVKGKKGETVTCTAEGDFSAVLRSFGIDRELRTVTINVTYVDDDQASAEIDEEALMQQLGSDLTPSDRSASVASDTGISSSSG
jgi:hypothetical protein